MIPQVLRPQQATMQTEVGFSAEPSSTSGRPSRRLASPEPSQKGSGSLVPTGPQATQHPHWLLRVLQEGPLLPGRWSPGLDDCTAQGSSGSCCLPHLLPDTAQMMQLPAGQALQQQLPTVMLRRSLQLGSLLGGPPASIPPAPKPGPETA